MLDPLWDDWDFTLNTLNPKVDTPLLAATVSDATALHL